MDRPDHSDAAFFLAVDITTSPAQGLKTLFVAGIRSLDQIAALAEEHNVKHVYLGANQSFQRNKAWAEIIPALIGKGYRVTLDFPNAAVEYVRELLLPSGILGSPSFIPVVSVAVPFVESLNKNLIVKIDDISYDGTNSGVWCVPAHSLLDSNRFTQWNEFGADQILLTNRDIKELRKKPKEKGDPFNPVVPRRDKPKEEPEKDPVLEALAKQAAMPGPGMFDRAGRLMIDGEGNKIPVKDRVPFEG